MESIQPPQSEYLTPEVFEELFTEDFVARVLSARRRSGEQKIGIGFELFERACWHLRWAAQIMCPRATAEERRVLVRRFFDIARELDDPGPKPTQ